MMHKENKTLAKAGRSGLRKGLTIIELSIGLVIVGIIVIAAFTGYNKIYIPTKAEAEYKKFTSIFSGIERSKALNGGVYPIGAGVITPTAPLRLVNALGGPNSLRDITGYAYTCAAGTGQRMTVVSSQIDDITVGALLADQINGSNSNWTAAFATNRLTATKLNNTCQ